MDHNEIMAEMINRYVKSAGWDEQPQIFTSSEFHGYITSPLPLSRGCSVKLVFYPNGQWQVGYIQLADEGGYLLQATGKDGKDYPAAAMGLASPTRKQLDQLLSEAGIDCTW
jgi:hypothetical protein